MSAKRKKTRVDDRPFQILSFTPGEVRDINEPRPARGASYIDRHSPRWPAYDKPINVEVRDVTPPPRTITVKVTTVPAVVRTLRTVKPEGAA